MRRPLKPFVTEYKQSNRRASPPLVEPAAPEAERPSPRSIDLPATEPADSYEAALRAADALFSGRPSQPYSDKKSGDPSAIDITPAFSDEPLKSEKGGRILRVLDEQPLPQLAALEAERAPKRRGRKPGSKNKPKAALLSAEVDSVHPPAAALSRPAAATPVRQTGIQVEALLTAPRAAKRTPWNRDRVRPGEEWKRRRLPRACW